MSLILELNPPAINDTFAPQPGSSLARKAERLRRGLEVIKLGTDGEQVPWLRRQLNAFLSKHPAGLARLDESSTKCDAALVEAIKIFQRHAKLNDDGIVGKNTTRALDLYFGRRPLAEQVQKTLPPPVAIEKLTAENIDAVLKHYSQGRTPPIRGEDILQICKEHNFDVSLLLSMAAQESSSGTAGLAVRNKNMFNLTGSNPLRHKQMKSWLQGLKEYVELMKEHYGDTAEEALRLGLRRKKDGCHYAAAPDYAQKIRILTAEVRSQLARLTRDRSADD